MISIQVLRIHRAARPVMCVRQSKESAPGEEFAAVPAEPPP